MLQLRIDPGDNRSPDFLLLFVLIIFSSVSDFRYDLLVIDYVKISVIKLLIYNT